MNVQDSTTPALILSCKQPVLTSTMGSVSGESLVALALVTSWARVKTGGIRMTCAGIKTLVNGIALKSLFCILTRFIITLRAVTCKKMIQK